VFPRNTYGKTKTTSRNGRTSRTRSKCPKLLSAKSSKNMGGCVQKLKNIGATLQRVYKSSPPRRKTGNSEISGYLEVSFLLQEQMATLSAICAIWCGFSMFWMFGQNERAPRAPRRLTHLRADSRAVAFLPPSRVLAGTEQASDVMTEDVRRSTCLPTASRLPQSS
jgi:hypothetical protein